MDNTCVCCGRIIPEGRQTCLVCENMAASPMPDAVLPDGTPLYFKTSNFPAGANLQMQLYEMLANGDQKRKENSNEST